MKNITLLLFNSLEEFNTFNDRLRPLFENEDGSIKTPFKYGTLHYLGPRFSSQDARVLTMADDSVRQFALSDLDVANILVNNAISKNQADSLGFFEETILFR